MKDNAEFDLFLKHFDSEISREIVEHVTEVVLLDSRYVFIKKNTNGVISGFCTHCNESYRMEKVLKHKSQTTCENCGSACTVYLDRYGRKYLVDTKMMVWYEKSRLDPERTLTARVLVVVRDYSRNYRNVVTTYRCENMYTFGYGIGSVHYQLQGRFNWYKRKTVFLNIAKMYPSYSDVACNLKGAVQGTPFEFVNWESYMRNNLLGFMDLAAKYPAAEYISKLYRKIMLAKLNGEPTYGAINWRGKTIQSVLRLNKAELKQYTVLNISLAELRFYQLNKVHGVKMEDCKMLVRIMTEWNAENCFKKMLQYGSESVIYKYLLKQMKKKSSHSVVMVMQIWEDYQQQLARLHMTGTMFHHRCPNDLFAAHKELTKRIKVIETEEVKQAIISRGEELQRYRYQSGRLMIKPIECMEELKREAETLDHCVYKDYSNNYAKSLTSLFVIRKIDQPEQPYYTVEIRLSPDLAFIRQCYGFDNDPATPEIIQFITEFANSRLLEDHDVIDISSSVIAA